MEITAQTGNIIESTADTIIVNLFEGVTTPGGATGAVDKALDGAISELISDGDISGKAKEIAVIYPRGKIQAKRVILVGLGHIEKFDLEAIRSCSATAITRARDLNAIHVATIAQGAGIGGIDVAKSAQATIEGAQLALYRFKSAKNNKDKENRINSFTIVENDIDKLTAINVGVRVAKAVVAGVRLARDLVNQPPNIATPTSLAETAEQIASEYGLAVTVGNRQWAAEKKMGAFLAVAKGAGEEPKFIILEHNANRTDLDVIVLIGKGITFDTGGISIKTSERMGEMKSDMGGAAAVLGTMKAVGILNLPLRVIGIAPCTENMPDANAYHPADVITASNGKTIEIISTDAEGRMVLADALVYAQQYKPQAVIDLATLTGACVVALGEGMAAGLFSNDDHLASRLELSAKTCFERVWRMPLWDDYMKMIESDVADMKNSGGRSGGVGSSAIFLKEFTDYPWAHLDIAGMALMGKSAPYTPAGGTGYGVRLLVDFLQNWS